MSVAPATKSISENPARMGVTEPTNVAAVEKDVETKMKLYGVIQAFRRGRLPDNRQIDQALKYFETHSPVTLEKLSPDGKKLIADCRELIETVRLQFQEKNADEALQSFVWHTSGEQFREHAVSKAKDAATDGGALPKKDQVSQDGQKALEHLRTLAQLILTNSEARKLVSDFGLISRDLVATGAANIAERARPDADRMARVDDPAPSQGWGGNSSQQGGNNLPTVSGDIDITRDGFRGSMKKAQEAAKQAADERADRRAHETHEKLHSSTSPTTGAALTAVPDGSRATATSAPIHGQYSTSANPDAPVTEQIDTSRPVDSGKEVAKAKANSMSSKVPEKHKERARLERDRAKQFFNEEFPRERRDQFIWRLKKVVTESQSHPNYQSSMTWFLDTLEQYFDSAKSASQSQGRSAQGVFGNDPVVQQAWTELRSLIERFAGGRTLDRFFDACFVLRDDARSDEEFRAWWRRANEFTRRTLLEPGFILTPNWNTQSDAIFKDQAKHFFDERYRGHRENIVNEFQSWSNGFTEDRLNRRFGDAWATLAKDLLFDSDGKVTWKGDLWNDIRTVILPEIIEKVGYVPIPRIEYTDDMVDLVVENLTLQGKNLFPNIVDFVGQTHVKFSPYKSIKDEVHSTMTITLTQIQADMRDVAFYFNKKSGFPKIKDSGLADVFLGGKGITVKLKVSSVAHEKSKGASVSLLRLDSCVAKVDTLKFGIRDSKHDLLYKTVRPLATGLIKKQIQKAIEDGIKTAFEFADAEIIKVRQRAEAAKQQEGSLLDKAKSVVSDKSSTTGGEPSEVRGHDMKKMEHPVSAATSKAEKRHSRFKVITSRDSSMFPEVAHEKSWVNKSPTVEGEEANGWKSPVFDVGESPSHHHKSATTA